MDGDSGEHGEGKQGLPRVRRGRVQSTRKLVPSSASCVRERTGVTSSDVTRSGFLCAARHDIGVEGISRFTEAQPHLEDGTAYRPKQPHRAPSHNSKTVLSTVHVGPLSCAHVAAYCVWAQGRSAYPLGPETVNSTLWDSFLPSLVQMAP